MLWVVSIALLLSYGFFQARFFIMGPQLTLESPAPHSVTASTTVTVRGSAENIVDITLNGLPIDTDTHGVFTYDVPIPLGYSILTLSAHDRFGREARVMREIIRKQ